MRPFDWGSLWSPTWPPWEVALRATLVYLFIQVLFRIVGRKELARYSTFDIALLFLLSVSLRRTLVGDDSSLTNGFVAIGTILGFDWLFSYLSSRSPRFADLLEGRVRQLVKDGKPVSDQMRRARIGEHELLAALREKQGKSSLHDVKDAFLERSGRISFVMRERSGGG